MELATATNAPLAVPDHIDEAARQTPDGVWARVSRSSSSVAQGWMDYTFSELARAVDHVAWWMERTIGVAQERGQVLGYIGANDVRYLVVLSAALKTGYVPLFPSPRNSLPGQRNLLEQTRCGVMITTTEMEGTTRMIQDAVPGLKVLTLPMATEILEERAAVAKYEGRHGRHSGDWSLVLHTSGSTGLPKPVWLTVGSIYTLYEQGSLPPEHGHERASTILSNKRPMFVPVPFFHAFGLSAGIRAIMGKVVLIRLPPSKFPSADLIMEVILAARPYSAILLPSMIEEVASLDRGMQALSKLDALITGGAPLSPGIGDEVSKVARLLISIGSTEALTIDTMIPTSPENWDYFHWASSAGVVMEPAEDDTWELVIKRKDIRYQAVFHTVPGLSEFRSKDLFRQHPSEPHLWKYVGRRDDILVLSNGEKFNPVATEKLLESHPNVKGALVVGKDRCQVALLLEPAWSADERQDDATLLHGVWPLVEQANREAPAHARIYWTKVAVLGPGKAFVRAAKGCIVRQQSVALLHDEIEALYADEGYASDEHGRRDSSDQHVWMSHKIRTIFAQIVPSFTEEVGDEVDIMSLGVDSLHVLALASALKKEISGANLTALTIYSNPSVKQLAMALSRKASKSRGMEEPLSREEKMEKVVRKYTHDMTRPASTNNTNPSSRPEKHTVILTGSTGSLGSHILEQLLQHPGVERIYCLNRSASAPSRQTATFTRYHSPSLSLAKASFLTTDFSRPKFGLGDAEYETLLASATLFIHNAWSVNFNLSLESYEATHIAGTRHAADFAASATHSPPVVFVSSVGSIGAWAHDSPVPETVTTLFDTDLVLPQGYSESKHVAGRILAVAGHRMGVKSAVVRAGQLAGSSVAHGGGREWNRQEWLPSLIHASKLLGMIPTTLGQVTRLDWLPMDIAAGGIIDISLAVADQDQTHNHPPPPEAEATDPLVFHLANPHPTSWTTLYPVIQAYYAPATRLQAVPYPTWLDALAALPATQENAERVPGLKLLAFYESMRPGGVGTAGTAMPVLQTGRCESVSGTVREVGCVGEGEVRKWLGQWGF